MKAIRYSWRVLAGLEELSIQKRLTVVLGAYIVYVLLFLVFFQLTWMEDSVVIFAVIPIYLTAIMFGLPGGVLSSLGTLLIDPLLFNWMRPETGYFGGSFWTVHLALFIIGLAFGYLNRMRRKLNREHEERQKVEAHLEHMSTHDPLTDLPNRAIFDELLGEALTQSRHRDEGLAVLMIDLDNFKSINDEYGHSTGDQVLKELGYRLKRSLRSSDHVARLGGDDFIAFIEGSSDKYIIARICERLIYNASQPFSFDDQELKLTISIGISRFPEDGDAPAKLFQLADHALCQVKQTRDNIYRFYEPEYMTD